MRSRLLLSCGVIVSCIILLSGCNNVGNTQSLVAQHQIIASQGFQGYSPTELHLDANFKDVAHGNGMYMIVGDRGSIYTSTNAIKWVEHLGVTNVNLNSVSYNSKHKTFYVVGDSGKIFSSADGVAWTEYQNISNNVSLNNIQVLPDGSELITGANQQNFRLELQGDDKNNSIKVHDASPEDVSNYHKDIATSNSLSIDNNTAYTFMLGSTNGNKSDSILYTKNTSHSGNKNTLHKTTATLNQIKCFSEARQSLCIAVGDKKSIIVLNSVNGEVTTNILDVSDPKILSFIPSNGEKNVSTNPIMEISFNKPVTNVDNSNIILYEDHQAVDTEIRLSNFDASSSDDEFTFKPSHKLKSYTRYIIVIKNGIQDKSGKTIEGKTYNFTTGEQSAPEVKSIIPADDDVAISTTPNIEVLFNEPVLNVNTTNITLHENSTQGNLVAISNPSTKGDTGYVFAPTITLKPLTTYCVVFASGITDIYGTKMNETSACFTTGSFAAPVVSLIKPNKLSETSQLTQIRFQFSKDVINVNLDSVTLHEGSATGAIVKLNTISVNDNRIYTTFSEEPLKLNTNYYLVLDSRIKDALNPENSLIKTIFGFKTTANNLIGIAAADGCVYGYTVSGYYCLTKSGKAMFKIVYSRGYKKFLAVGQEGFSLSLSDLGSASRPIDTGARNELWSVALLNEIDSDAVAVGDNGAIVVSHDMGKTWAVKTDKLNLTDKDLKNVYSDGTHFFIAVNGSEWLYSVDKGDTWSKKTDTSTLPIHGIPNILSGNSNYRIVGGKDGIIYTSSDNMQSWVQQPSVLYKSLGRDVYSNFNAYVYVKDLDLNILFGDSNTVFTSTGDGIIKNHWARVTAFDDLGGRVKIVDASAGADGNISALAWESGNSYNRIYLSTNGTHWRSTSLFFYDYVSSIATAD